MTTTAEANVKDIVYHQLVELVSIPDPGESLAHPDGIMDEPPHLAIFRIWR